MELCSVYVFITYCGSYGNSVLGGGTSTFVAVCAVIGMYEIYEVIFIQSFEYSASFLILGERKSIPAYVGNFEVFVTRYVNGGDVSFYKAQSRVLSEFKTSFEKKLHTEAYTEKRST